MENFLYQTGLLIKEENFYRWVDVIEANDNVSLLYKDNSMDYDSSVLGLFISIY